MLLFLTEYVAGDRGVESLKSDQYGQEALSHLAAIDLLGHSLIPQLDLR